MRQYVGTAALIGALSTLCAMAWNAAVVSQTNYARDIVDERSLWLMGAFGVFVVLGAVGAAIAKDRTDGFQAMIISLSGVTISFLWILSGLELQHGRPWRISRFGRPRTARAMGRSDWSAPDTAQRNAISADRWLRAALDEHASIAAFSRLAIDLLAHGAPAALVRRVSEAAIEEIRHAELCFGRAAALGQRGVGPGELPVAALGTPTLAALARDSLLDGCLGEGVAAAYAARSAAIASDARAREVWTEIARDEASHAELAWAVVEWAIVRGGAPIEDELRRAMGRLGTTAVRSSAIEDREQGWLGAAAEESERDRVIVRVNQRLTSMLRERRAA